MVTIRCVICFPRFYFLLLTEMCLGGMGVFTLFRWGGGVYRVSVGWGVYRPKDARRNGFINSDRPDWYSGVLPDINLIKSHFKTSCVHTIARGDESRSQGYPWGGVI